MDYHSSLMAGEATLNPDIRRVEDRLQALRARRSLLEDLLRDVANEEELLLHLHGNNMTAHASAPLARIPVPPTAQPSYRPAYEQPESPPADHEPQQLIVYGDSSLERGAGRAVKRARPASPDLLRELELVIHDAQSTNLDQVADTRRQHAGHPRRDRQNAPGNNRPGLPRSQIYRVTCARDHENFVSMMEDHFRTNPSVYSRDAPKISEALRRLSLEIRENWSQRLQVGSVDATWADFCAVVLHQIGCKMHRDTAHKQYQKASQGSGQSVRQFADHLQHLYGHMLVHVATRHRNRHLWSRIRPDVRDEASSPPSLDLSFAEFTSEVEDVERQMLRRRGGR